MCLLAQAAAHFRALASGEEAKLDRALAAAHQKSRDPARSCNPQVQAVKHARAAAATQKQQQQPVLYQQVRARPVHRRAPSVPRSLYEPVRACQSGSAVPLHASHRAAYGASRGAGGHRSATSPATVILPTACTADTRGFRQHCGVVQLCQPLSFSKPSVQQVCSPDALAMTTAAFDNIIIGPQLLISRVA